MVSVFVQRWPVCGRQRTCINGLGNADVNLAGPGFAAFQACLAKWKSENKGDSPSQVYIRTETPADERLFTYRSSLALN
jgi:hypothetical protein